MPPKAVKSRAPAQEPNFGSSVLQTFTSQDNRPIVTAMGLFAVGVAFLHSNWAEILLPA